MNLSMTLFVNTLIYWKDKDITERVLWTDVKSDVAFLIDINENTYKPTFRVLSDICDNLNWGYASIVKEDPYSRIIAEENIKDSRKEKRDKAWDVVSFIIVSCGEPQIYNSKIRSGLIKEASKKFGISDRTTYEYLRKYWQRGKTKNALLPDFDNCGGKNHDKDESKNKRGRPRKYNSKGINVDDRIKKIFRLALNKFYYTTKENSLMTAYQLMRKEYYSDGYRYDNGVKKPLLIDSSVTPSFGQFRYWYLKDKNLKKEVSMRKSAKRYYLENREVLGNSTQEATGPGAIYQIDATIADVYLVSSYLKNEIIGRPIVYAVIDVYSHLIVGVYVGLEGPSWLGAMMALSNAITNKVEFCNKYGITISDLEWPVNDCIPESIIADRGELEGKNIENLVSGLNIKISNTASSRGDLKGIVEQFFNTINTRIKPFIPGTVGGDFQMRGGKDYRLDAKLDIRQFTKVIIKCVLYHNNHHWMDNYKREEMMIEDDIKPIPIEIWNWGVKNKSGKLRNINQDIVRLNLMPRDKGTVTGRGIRFKGIFYYSKIAMIERWFEKAKNEGSWKVDVSYDPQCMDYVYMIFDNGKKYDKCLLLNHEDRYNNKTLEEIEFLLQYEKIKSYESKDKELQAKTDLISDIEDIVKEANEQVKMFQHSGESNTQKLKGIRKNRTREKLVIREQEAWNIGKNDSKGVEKIESQNIEDNKYSLEEDIKLFKKKQREKLQNAKIDSN